MKYDPRMLGFLDPTHLVETGTYAAVFVFSILQSCCVPTSSELTMGFAGVLASQGRVSLVGVILVGVVGEVVGAYVAWVLGRFGGRKLVDRFGKHIWLSHNDLDRAQLWYQRHDRFGVFGSRLLPVIRNFVAFPAGIAEVPLVRFGLLTAAGSAIWLASFALIGYEVGDHWKSIARGFGDVGYGLAALAVMAILFGLHHRRKNYKASR
jgi:membrane protein DedA with SNARE-associated domain